MRRSVWIASAGLAGCGFVGVILGAVAQDGHDHGHGGGGIDPFARWSGPPQVRTMTNSYVPETHFTHNPLPAPPGGPPPTGPGEVTSSPNLDAKPPPGSAAEVVDEPLPSETTSTWENFWETHRDEILAERTPAPPREAGPVRDPWEDRALQAILRSLFDRDDSVAGMAALAAGLTARPEVQPLLAEAATGTRTRPGPYLRMFATLGLGLVGDPRAGHALREIAEGNRPVAMAGPQGPQPGRPAGPDAPPILPGPSPDGGPPRPKDEAGGAAAEAALQRRAMALLALGLIESPEHAMSLAALAMDFEAPCVLRTSAAVALGRAPSPEAARALHDLVFGGHIPHALRAIAAVGVGRTAPGAPFPTLRPARSAELLCEWLVVQGSTSRSARIGMATALIRCATAADVHAIRLRLGGGRESVEMAPPPRDGAKPGEPPDPPRVVERVVPHERDATVKGLLCLALGRAARNADADGKAAARTVLLHYLDEAKGCPPALRGYAALALGLAGDAAAAPELRTVVTKGPEPQVSAAAALALGLIGDAQAWKPVVERLPAVVDYRAGYFYEALGLLGTPDARKYLRHAFTKTGDPHVRRATALALARLGDGEIADALLEDLAHPQRDRAMGAVEALVRLGVRDRLPALARRATLDHDPHVRGRALLVLGHLLRPAGKPRGSEYLADHFGLDEAPDQIGPHIVKSLSSLFW